jgi:hypothetical protein
LAKEEEARLATEQAKKKAETEIKELKKDIDDLEMAVSKVYIIWCRQKKNDQKLLFPFFDLELYST